MLIKTLAFKIDIPSWTTLQTFNDYLIGQNCQPFGASEEYLIAVDRSVLQIGTHSVKALAGVLLRTKDSRTFTTLANSAGALTVAAEELDAGTSVVDFNHFILNEETGMGIYQHYYQAVTLPRFLALLGKCFHDYENLTTNKNINKSQSDAFAAEQYMTQQALTKLLGTMQKIAKVEYKLVSQATDSRFGIPSNKLKYVKNTVAYDLKTTALADIVSKIKNQLNTNSSDYEQVWVSGSGADGEDVVYKMAHDFGCFKKDDYDSVARSLVLDLKNVSASLKGNIPLKEMKAHLKNDADIQSFFI
jgi:hypothetical protein